MFRSELDVKVLGALRCIQHVAPHMIRAGWGRIITISGLAARQPTSIIGSTRNAVVVDQSAASPDYPARRCTRRGVPGFTKVRGHQR